MDPMIGRMVHYKISADDEAIIGQERLDYYVRGNHIRRGDVYPAVIVRRMSSIDEPLNINLQVMLDGEDVFWATSKHVSAQGEHKEGEWVWPPSA